jgi:hypothetical protein
MRYRYFVGIPCHSAGDAGLTRLSPFTRALALLDGDVGAYDDAADRLTVEQDLLDGCSLRHRRRRSPATQLFWNGVQSGPAMIRSAPMERVIDDTIPYDDV